MHGKYQQLIHALSAAGVLIGVASKNDRSLVDEVFQRKDLILPRSAIFPMEIHWGPKSESVSKILKTWNVGDDSVVFIDDSPMELAEVKASHPDVECIQFPGRNNEAIHELFYLLQDLFGKSLILEEDTFRLDSIRRAHSHAEAAKHFGTSPEHFLKQAEAELMLNFSKDPLEIGRATSELQSRSDLVCRLLLEKKKIKNCAVDPSYIYSITHHGIILRFTS